MFKLNRKTLLYFFLCTAFLFAFAAPAVLTASASIQNAPMAPGHQVNFQVVGLPDGVSFTITGTRWNNGTHPTDYSTSFTTPDLSATIGTDPGSEFTYTGFPASYAVGMQYFELVSTEPSSPFTTGASGGSTTVVATYASSCLPAVITVDPGDQTAQYGDAVTLMVTATGSPVLAYAWYKDDNPITGADQASYTIPSVSMGDAGAYYAVVTNTCGTDTSSSAQLTVSKANQLITFAPPATPAVYNTSFTVAPTASSGLPVTLVASGACSNIGYEVTMESGMGVCVLVSTQAGDGNYLPAPDVVRTVDAAKASQTIDFPAPPSPAVYGTSFNLEASSSSGLPVSFQVAGVCSLLGTEVTMTSGSGTCTITASQVGDDNYAPADDVVHGVVAAWANQTIDFPAPPSPAVHATSFTLEATASSGLIVSFQVEGVCSLAGTEVTMTSGTGACTIIASQLGNDYFAPAPSVVRTVVAAKANQTIDFSPPASPAVYGASFNLEASSSSGLPVSFEVDGVCSLVGTELTMTSGWGICTITAKQDGNDNFNLAPGVVYQVKAARASQTITFVQPPSPVKYQTSFIVSPTSSSGLPVALVANGSCTNNGYTVTMIKTSGDCVLTASQAGDLNYLYAESVQHSVAPAPNGNVIFLPLLLEKLQ